MEIILSKDVPTLGYRGDIVNVKPGYARNFLIPQGIAVVANPSNRKMHAELAKQAANKLNKRRDDANALANLLSSLNLELSVKTGTTGRIFGSITTNQVAHLLKDMGHPIDRRLISFPEPIKEIGPTKVVVECYKEIKATINLNIKAEEK